MLIGVATTGVGIVTTFDLQHCPEALLIKGATTQLQGLKVEVLGTTDGTICDLDAAGITAIGRHRQQGVAAGAYIIPLATGIITGKNVRITVTNSAAQTPTLYSYGDGNFGQSYFISKKQTIIQNSNTTFDSFHAMFFPNFGANDYLTATYKDSNGLGQLSQIMTYDDLYYVSGVIQTTLQVQVDNCESNLDRIQVMVSATQTAYMVYSRLI